MAFRETAPPTAPDHAGPATPVLWFAAWALTGMAGALGFVSLGPILLGPAVILGGALSSRPAARRWRAGLPAGAGLVFLYIAYLQRHGPGTTCWHTGTAAGCDQSLDPIPWLVVAVLLLGWTVVSTTWARRAS
jgi:hypothetical protein